MNCAEPLDITELSASVGFTDAGVVSTIPDLGRYAQALAAGALLPDGVDRFDDPLAVYSGAPPGTPTAGGAIRPARSSASTASVPGYSTAAFSDPRPGSPSPSCSTTPRAGAAIAAVPGVGARRDRIEGARRAGRDRSRSRAAVDGAAVPRRHRGSRDLPAARPRDPTVP